MMLWHCIVPEAFLLKRIFWAIPEIGICGSPGPIIETHEPILVFNCTFVELVALWQTTWILSHDLSPRYTILGHDS
jgi:hypothetical protein